MWYQNENGSQDKPAAVDRETSKVYVYIRRNFRLIEADGEERPAHWVWEEAKISKDALVIYEEQNEAFDDVYAALTELAELIAGEE